MTESAKGSAKEKTVYTKEQVEELKLGLVELASQEKSEFGAKELILEALPEIRAALEKHSYKYLAQWMSEKQQIQISEGSLKQYVSQAIKRQSEKAQPKADQTEDNLPEQEEPSTGKKPRRNSTSSGGRKKKDNNTDDKQSENENKKKTPENLPQGNSNRKSDY